jgi:hypothetical protein
MLRRDQAVVIYLDVAEKLVVLLFAGGQIQRVEHHRRIGAARLHALAIQIVIVGDLEADFDRGTVERLGFDAECLFDRQQVVFVCGVDGVGAESGEQRAKRGYQSIHRQIVAEFCPQACARP